MCKNSTELLFIFLLVFATSSTTAAENLKLEIILPEQLTPNQEYNHIFKIINTDFKRGSHFNINATVSLKITSENFSLNKTFTLKEINWYKKPRLEQPFIPARNKTYLICVEIINSSINDTNQSDDELCKTATTNNKTQTFETENSNQSHPAISIQILNQNKTIVEGETIFFKHIINCSSNSSITYWIEDIYGNIAKAKRNTTSLSKKQWKTKAYSQVSPYFIKSILFCGRTNISVSATFFVLKTHEEQNKQSTEKEQKEKADDNKTNKRKTSKDHCANEIYIKAPQKGIFGNTINVAIQVHRCKGRKRKVELKIIDKYNFTIAKTKLNINSTGKFLFTIPLNIPPCSYCYSGNYTIIANGLNTNTSSKIFLEQQTKHSINTNTQTSNKKELILKAKKMQLPPKEIHSKQTKHIFPYLFFTLIGLLPFIAKRR
ncbi:hypothetical protein DRJ16_04715 [Candidatus Woesearchaeota archaeon]|nr:MAG: hypothetical protein DRJ16_04715 [Candidatus Woesearchaeota archaeon]